MMSGVGDVCPSEHEEQQKDCLSKATDDIWMPDPRPLCSGGGDMTEAITMETFPVSSVSFDDMPPLETFPTSHTVHYTSPVHASFLESDPHDTSKDLRAVAAKHGISGLRNLGNTCFMNSGLQCLNSNPSLVRFLLEEFPRDEALANETITGACAEIIQNIWSGHYSVIHPGRFKAVLGSYHPQFKDFRQHDCQEFLALLLDGLHEQLNSGKMWHTNQLGTSSAHSDTEFQLDAVSVKSDSTSNQSEAVHNSGSSSPVELEHGNQPHPSPAMGQCGQSNCISEDSNNSELSQQSVEAQRQDDVHRRMGPIPECIKSKNKDTEEMEVDEPSPETLGGVPAVQPNPEILVSEQSVLEENASANNASIAGKRLPSIEDFYMKGTKTLNTNVLATEFINETVTTDSEKFHKPDNVARPTDPYEHLTDFLMSEVKGAGAKPLKETNLLANVKDKFSEEDPYTKKCLFSELDKEEEGCSINNIKRIKIDEDEKNIRMQAKLKVNTNKNPTKDTSLCTVEGATGGDQGQRSPERGGALAGLGPSETVEHWEDSVIQADRAWAKYTEHNCSVIVDTFQGQFKSTVVCAECHHVSVTYEPFMYLSVPLPHAMSRQISVIFVPCDSKQTVRYLLTMHKQDNIRKVKAKLLELIGEESCDIIVAEVFDNHIARILEDNTLLKYINNVNRTIYAFEMMPPPQIDDITPGSDDASTLTDDVTSGSDDTLTGANNLVSATANNAIHQSVSATATSPTSQSDVFSNMGVFALEEGQNSETKFVINNQNNSKLSSNVVDNKELEAHSILNNLGDPVSSGWSVGFTPEGLDWQENLLKETSDGDHSVACNEEPGTDGVMACYQWKQSSTESDDVVGEADIVAQWGVGVSASEESETKGEDTAGEGCGDGSAAVTTDQWKSCAICLDDMADSDLMAHTACGGTLCQACLEMSFKHYGESSFICPVCSSSVSPVDDFLQLSAMADYKPKTRILPIPIVQRFDRVGEDNKLEMMLFGHPSILYLPSQMSGEFLYESVDRVAPCLVNYSILLTDGQGYHCSRCMYTAHCSGCEVARDQQVTLQPGDHLALRFYDNLTEDQMEGVNKYMDHKSMEDLRPDTPLTLTDCFKAFMDSEVLDEHNPWFCPRCKKNQCARKTMTVWRYPQTLVVYLKRFVFHELSSTKIDNKVVFPLEDLDLSDYMSGPKTSSLLYDLHSCVCHFGGVNAGHYTAYSKHPLDNEWLYFNDETAMEQTPHEGDYSSTYILFYQRKGSDVTFKLPEKKMENGVIEPALGLPLSGPSYQPTPLNNDAICEFLEELDEDIETSGPAQETLDFYS